MKQILTSIGLLLLLTFLSPSCNAQEEQQFSGFVGPYFIRFNDTIYPSSTGGNFDFDYTVRGLSNEYSIAGFSLRLGNNFLIVIEEYLGEAEKYLPDSKNVGMHLSITPDYIVEKHQRRIAGYEGTMEIAQNKTEQHSIAYGTFRLRSKTTCDDTTNGRLAIVQISCLDYTKEDFDRILDTFEIVRYLTPNNGENHLPLLKSLN
jgi:hypothetical protein